jgi:hypothetical protein
MLRIQVINGLAELERFGVKYEPAGQDEVKFRCPVHEDESPSAALNIVKNLWKCHAAECTAKGDIVSLLAYCGDCKRETIIADLSERYPDLVSSKTVSQDAIEKFHRQIWESGPFLKALYDRGITDDDIRTNRIGFHNGRITIPVYNTSHQVINVRRYLPGAPGPEKMHNLKGYKTTYLYPVEKAAYPTLWICGGEMKAVIVNRLLNEHNIGAICVTAGEGTWNREFNPFVKDKQLFICMDVDIGGRSAARKIGKQIFRLATAVHIIQLPLNTDKYPKGDINDYIAGEGGTADDLLNLMKAAERFTLESEEKADAPAKECKLISAAKADNVGKKVKFDALLTAIDTTPYVVPKEIAVTCTKDTELCGSCKAFILDPDEVSGVISVEIEDTNPFLLDMILSSQSSAKELSLAAMGAPGCKNCNVRTRKHHNIYDCRLTPPLDISSHDTIHVLQAGYLVAEEAPELNIPYRFTGRTWGNPKTNQATLLLNEIQILEDTLSSCTFQSKELKELEIFQPVSWDLAGLTAKLDDLYDDLAKNVTRIFYRQNLHLSFDLTWYSALHFKMEGRIQNGWVNCLITGDSSQGKSEVANRLIEHYKLGTRHDCKGASEAGLLGGLQQMGSRWFVSWGVIPLHDRQLVIMEEIKGATTGVLGRLTDMRSSGFAEITKIEHRKTHARTRLIMISNPRSDRQVSAYTYGVEIVKELIGQLEDVRRFDFVHIVSTEELCADDINQAVAETPFGEPFYSGDLCRRLILWSWTREASQIKFTDSARKACIQLSTKLCQDFSETIPICDKGTMRHKLGRLATALACRTFSTEDTEHVLVRPCHIEYIWRFLDSSYRAPHVGYASFTHQEKIASKLADPAAVRRALLALKRPKEVIETILNCNAIEAALIEDLVGLDRDTVRIFISTLVRKRAIIPAGSRVYYKSPEFVTLLKNLLREDIPEKDDQPEF